MWVHGYLIVYLVVIRVNVVWIAGWSPLVLFWGALFCTCTATVCSLVCWYFITHARGVFFVYAFLVRVILFNFVSRAWCVGLIMLRQLSSPSRNQKGKIYVDDGHTGIMPVPLQFGTHSPWWWVRAKLKPLRMSRFPKTHHSRTIRPSRRYLSEEGVQWITRPSRCGETQSSS